MAIRVSTGTRNQMLGYKNLRDIFDGCYLKIYSGTIPDTADAAVTGTLLATITNASIIVKAKQKIRFTPTTGGTTGTWTIVLNGVTFTFTDDASPTAAEICTGLYRLINTGQAASSKYFTNSTDGAITAGGIINDPKIYRLFALTDNTGTLDIEAATAGVPFDYSATATGAGNSMATSIQTADAYGLRWEAYADIASGIIEKLSSQTWSGVAVAEGTATYGRFVLDSDTGGSSTSEPRIQGYCGTTSTAEIRLSHTAIVTGETLTCSSFSITAPAQRT
jgi:hypothetical protein